MNHKNTTNLDNQLIEEMGSRFIEAWHRLQKNKLTEQNKPSLSEHETSGQDCGVLARTKEITDKDGSCKD